MTTTKIIWVAATVAVLTGCTSAPPSSESIIAGNAIACTRFATAYNDIATPGVPVSSYKDRLASLESDYREAGHTASGTLAGQIGYAADAAAEFVSDTTDQAAVNLFIADSLAVGYECAFEHHAVTMTGLAD